MALLRKEDLVPIGDDHFARGLGVEVDIGGLVVRAQAFLGSLVVAETDEYGVAQVTVRGVFAELHFADQDRLNPAVRGVVRQGVAFSEFR